MLSSCGMSSESRCAGFRQSIEVVSAIVDFDGVLFVSPFDDGVGSIIKEVVRVYGPHRGERRRVAVDNPWGIFTLEVCRQGEVGLMWWKWD